MGLRMDDIHAPTIPSGPRSGASVEEQNKQLSLQELISRKEALEVELSALGSVLDSHGVNMNTSLTTFDGYPRADIDVAQIRTTRASIIRLKNDYKSTMSKLEAAVHEQFAANKAGSDDTNAEQGINSTFQPLPTRTAEAHPSSVELPFAKVNSVAPDSPASSAGLLAGDKVVDFGRINYTNHERLSKVAEEMRLHENRVLRLRVLRQSSDSSVPQALELRLTPRSWSGRGLLGCHLVPL